MLFNTQFATILVSSLLFSNTHAAVLDTNTVKYCDHLPPPTSEGFNVKFYTFDYFARDETKFDVQKSTFDYKNKTVKGTRTKIVNPNFDTGNLPSQPDHLEHEIYGSNIDVYQTLTELSGYFKAHESGNYTFTINADNNIIAWIGDGKAFNCYADSSSLGRNASDNLVTASFTPRSKTVELKKDHYYPIKFNHVNYFENAVLTIEFTTPSGEHIRDDWTGYIYQFAGRGPGGNGRGPGNGRRPGGNGNGHGPGNGNGDHKPYGIQTSTTYWDEDITSTTLVHDSTSSHVVVYLPPTTITTTIPWTGTFTKSHFETGSVSFKFTKVIETPGEITPTPEESATTFTTTGSDGSVTHVIKYAPAAYTYTVTECDAGSRDYGYEFEFRKNHPGERHGYEEYDDDEYYRYDEWRSGNHHDEEYQDGHYSHDEYLKSEEYEGYGSTHPYEDYDHIDYTDYNSYGGHHGYDDHSGYDRRTEYDDEEIYGYGYETEYGSKGYRDGVQRERKLNGHDTERDHSDHDARQFRAGKNVHARESELKTESKEFKEQGSQKHPSNNGAKQNSKTHHESHIRGDQRIPHGKAQAGGDSRQSIKQRSHKQKVLENKAHDERIGVVDSKDTRFKSSSNSRSTEEDRYRGAHGLHGESSGYKSGFESSSGYKTSGKQSSRPGTHHGSLNDEDYHSGRQTGSRHHYQSEHDSNSHLTSKSSSKLRSQSGGEYSEYSHSKSSISQAVEQKESLNECSELFRQHLSPSNQLVFQVLKSEVLESIAQ